MALLVVGVGRAFYTVVQGAACLERRLALSGRRSTMRAIGALPGLARLAEEA